MITSPEPTGVDMGQTHDDWHEWRHGTDKRLDAIEHELRMIRWILGFMAAALVALIGMQIAVVQALLSLR